MAMMEATARPLTEAEKRLLRWAISHRKRRLHQAMRRMLTFGTVVFGSLWGFTVLATILDKGGPSWYVSGLIWLALGTLMTMWAYAGVRSDLSKQMDQFKSALRQNIASIYQVQTDQFVEFAEKEDEGASYAFQLAGERIIFVSGQEFYSSPQFPSSDFSLVEIRTQDGVPIIGHIERRGKRIEPIRTIANGNAAFKIPGHLQLIHGDLSKIEQLLS